MTDFPTRDQFRRWLSAKSPGYVVAEAWSGCDCPLAVFLNEVGAIDPAVWCEGRIWVWTDNLNAGDGPAPMPEWAADFADRVDAWAAVRGGPLADAPPITAAECAGLLERCAA